MDVDPVVDWLLRDATAISDISELMNELTRRLTEVGLQVDRIFNSHMTLHPEMLGRSVTWEPGADLDVEVLGHGPLPQAAGDAPISRIAAGEREVRARLCEATDARSATLKAAGFTDYFIARGPSPSALDRDRARALFEQADPDAAFTGVTAVAAWATRRPGGWSDEEVDAIRKVHAAFSLVTGYDHQHRVTEGLLRSYLGADAGRRVLAGQVRRGEVRTLEAAILFTDLRGFTALSEELEPKLLLEFLSDAFDAQIGAIEQHGGAVLQIVGDGLLAIFEADGSPGPACRAALSTVDAIELALAETNRRRVDAGLVEIGWGAGLHYGEVNHGNFGSASRLAFTVNGRAVNEAARLEAIGARLEVRPALSERFSQLCDASTRRVGEHQAKGLTRPIVVYARADD